MQILQTKFLGYIVINISIFVDSFHAAFFLMSVKILRLLSIHFRKYEFVILRIVRNDSQMVFRSRLPFIFFQNTSHFQKKSNIVSRNRVEMCVVRCKGNSAIFPYWKNGTKTWKHFSFIFRCLELLLTRHVNIV